MHKVHIILKTVTPLFLGGANPRGAPELRPTPFRGALRFWLRALLGGVLGDDVKAVQDAESKVFGSTQYASPITVQVGSESAPTWRPYRPLLHNPQRAFVFKGIETGYEFTLQLRARSGSPSVFDVAAASLALLVLLGGVGKRSRRGFGTLQLKYTEDTNVELWRAIEPRYVGWLTPVGKSSSLRPCAGAEIRKRDHPVAGVGYPHPHCADVTSGGHYRLGERSARIRSPGSPELPGRPATRSIPARDQGTRPDA